MLLLLFAHLLATHPTPPALNSQVTAAAKKAAPKKGPAAKKAAAPVKSPLKKTPTKKAAAAVKSPVKKLASPASKKVLPKRTPSKK